MKFCQKCQLEMDDKYKFCYQCGGKLQEKIETVFCPYCGEKVETEGEFCPFCGKSFVEEIVSVLDEPVVPKRYVKMQPLSVKKEKTFFTFEIFFSSDGRMGRLTYFIVSMFWYFMSLVLTFLGKIFSSEVAPLVLSVLFYPICWFSNYCILVKRFHDLGKSTNVAQKTFVIFWGLSLICWITVMISPSTITNNLMFYFVVVMFIIGFELFVVFAKGEESSNQYGPKP